MAKMMNQEHFNSVKPPIRKDKNIAYEGKKYPIDFSLLKKYSNYFYKNKHEYKFTDDIEINPDGYEISDESLQMFIKFCQNEPFDLNDENVLTLLHLSNQYDVALLSDLANQYISKNQSPLIFRSILFKLLNQKPDSNINLTTEEDIIASHFFDCINDEQLLMLPIPVLYRIINKEQLNINSMDLTKQGQFIEFLFKCLDKHKRVASILFLNIDIENERVDILPRLLNFYSDVFDFNFINSKYLSKSASFLLNELKKLKIEMSNKIAEIESTNEKQKDFFTAEQKEFNDSKIDLLNSNRSLEVKIAELERKLNEQSIVIERYKRVKVRKIEIESDQKFVRPGTTVTLNASVCPEMAFIDGVEWSVVKDNDVTVCVESKNERTIVLKILSPGKVTVVATALDGSEVKASKEILFSQLRGRIEVNVQQNQLIKGRIEITEDGESKLDTAKSKYILNTDSSPNLGSNAFQSGSKLDALVKEVSFKKERGDYYLHVLVVDSFGSSQELVSESLHTEGTNLCFGYTGSVQQVDLEPGSYKLEAWGAQGGSFDSSFCGGYGGYSTGTIKLESKTTLYVVVGQAANSDSGGYNGGGSSHFQKFNSSYTFKAFGGGGASHIGLKSGTLNSFSGDFNANLLIAAGGGGGAVGTDHSSDKRYNSKGGSGGGFNGADGCSTCSSDQLGTGATQSQGGTNSYWKGLGSFGQGSSCAYHKGCYEGGGGGGGFYGGGSGGSTGGGGGGSGFINITKLSDAFMFGYNVPKSESASTKTFSTSSVSSDPVSNNAKQNDGYVKITLI